MIPNRDGEETGWLNSDILQVVANVARPDPLAAQGVNRAPILTTPRFLQHLLSLQCGLTWFYAGTSAMIFRRIILIVVVIVRGVSLTQGSLPPGRGLCFPCSRRELPITGGDRVLSRFGSLTSDGCKGVRQGSDLSPQKFSHCFRIKLYMTCRDISLLSLATTRSAVAFVEASGTIEILFELVEFDIVIPNLRTQSKSG